MLRTALILSLFALTLAIPSDFYHLAPRNENGGVNWAVLVAGSNGYDNYRHQADVCHAYQVLKANGFEDQHVIVMMYDDIAYNPNNPKPGVIQNRSGGPNVYAGVVKDYVKTAVTAANFYNILQGLPTTGGSGKTVASSPNDNIFVFYSDHGSPGLICMPVGAYVYADQLSIILKDMAATKRFNKFLFYVEACESGSMFYSGYLPSNISIYATTASTPYESSWACNYDSTLETYLGDCYSVNWMDYTDSIDVEQTSVQTEFEYVYQATTESTVCAYGDTGLTPDMLGVYMKGRTNTTLAQSQKIARSVPGASQRLIEEGLLKEKYLGAQSNEERNKIAAKLADLQALRRESQSFFVKFGAQTLGKKYAHQLSDFKSFLPKVMDEDVRAALPLPLNRCDVNEIGQLVFDNFQCYREVNEMVREACGPMDSYSLQFVPVFASLCQLTNADYEAFRAATLSLCSSPIWG